MKIAIFQPPYPHEGTVQAAIACMDWMKSQLKTLIGKNIDLIIFTLKDGVHLTEKGNQLLAKLVLNAIKENIKVII